MHACIAFAAQFLAKRLHMAAAGWAVGVMAAPGAMTYAGGGVLLIATVIVIVAAHKRQSGK